MQQDAMIVSHFPHGPTVFFTLHNVNLRHDIESYKSSTVSEQYPHLIFENFSSQLGVRIGDVLKYLFPVPKEDSKRVMTFSNEDDFISFRCGLLVLTPLYPLLTHTQYLRHHVFVKTSAKQVQLAEVGPRFEMKRQFITLPVTTICLCLLTQERSLRNPTRNNRAERSRTRMGTRTLLTNGQEAEFTLSTILTSRSLNRGRFRTTCKETDSSIVHGHRLSVLLVVLCTSSLPLILVIVDTAILQWVGISQSALSIPFT